MYSAADLESGRRVATARLAKMFQVFLKRPDLLPENYSEAALSEPLHRVICDYIAGMTDPYFERVYSSEVVKLDSSAERTP
jgi:dGTPase